MTLLNWSKKWLLLCVAVATTGCTAISVDSTSQYQVGAGSAIFAGSSLPFDKTVTGVEIYFGHHMVRPGGAGRGCCYQTAMGFVNSGKPRGGALAVWSATEYGDEKEYSQSFDRWLKKPVWNRYYYAAANPSRLASYPAMSRGHRFYGIYLSAGKVVVSERGLRPDSVEVATRLPAEEGTASKYVLGREDTLYYKIISHGSGSSVVADDSSTWHTIPGVVITELQYEEIRRCSRGRDCRWFLSLDDPDLTPEQREYIQRNPFSPADMKPLIRRLDRSRRQHERWL